MIQIQRLDWDTKFFGYTTGKLVLTNNSFFNSNEIDIDDYELVYIFSEQALEESDCMQLGATLLDVKVELIKPVKNNVIPLENVNHLSIKIMRNLSNDLLHLVLESGKYSRFKLDKHFVNNEFEKLYKVWIEKALNGMHEQVLGAYIDNILVGFVSIKNQVNDTVIDLIAVHQNWQGRHIGKKILEVVNSYAIQNNCAHVKVVTQENNLQAMHFYQHNDFEIHKKNYIYHLWKKTS
jgi:dTDP-4-amino-4,6-dideoxy-D-galactose acyltransferase